MVRFGTSRRGNDTDYDDLYNFSGSSSTSTAANDGNSSSYSGQQGYAYRQSATSQSMKNYASSYDYDDFGDARSNSGGMFGNLRRSLEHQWLAASQKQRIKVGTILLAMLGGMGILVAKYAFGGDNLFEGGSAEFLDPEVHKKASVMTMGPPYDRMRDVVWDQPYRKSDTIVFWQTPETGENIIPKMLSECFQLTLSSMGTGQKYSNEKQLQVYKSGGNAYLNVDATSTEGIERMNELNVIESNMVDVIVSPHVREICDIFSWDNQGRMFAFFRHPIEREYERVKAGDIRDNHLVRLLINKREGELNFVDLGNAKKVVREKTVVGLLDSEYKTESMERIVKYFGWEGSDVCVEEFAARMPDEELGDVVDGSDEQWELVHKHNQYDVQLYEYARTTFRAQKQTLVPLAKQFELFGDRVTAEEEVSN